MGVLVLLGVMEDDVFTIIFPPVSWSGKGSRLFSSNEPAIVLFQDKRWEKGVRKIRKALCKLLYKRSLDLLCMCRIAL